VGCHNHKATYRKGACWISLSDGYIEMPANLLRDPQNKSVPQAAEALRLSVNCFALAGPGVDGVMIDSGGKGFP